MSDFWARKLGTTPPPHVPPAAAPGSAWWMTPASVPAQTPTPHSGVPGGDSAFTYQQLKSMRADQMSQDQMEALAMYELQEAKYNNVCPQCGSANFIPAGTKTGTSRMSTDRCFDCGAGCRSPEPALGGRGSPGSATRQLDGGQGSYGRHISQIPSSYIPRG